MDIFLKWLSANPPVTNVLLLVLSLVVLALIFMYVTAVREGRDVSFWPPHIGKKPEKKNTYEEAKSFAIARAVKPHLTKQSSSFFLTAKELEVLQSVEDVINQSDDLLLGGVALGHAAKRHRAQLLKQLEKGARLRFLVLDPTSPDIEAMAKIFEVPTEQIRDDIRVTLRDLDVLRNKTKVIKCGSVDIRLLHREPPFSLPSAILKAPMDILVQVFGCMVIVPTTRPYFVFRQTDMWFPFFVESCENLWNDSEQWPRIGETLKPISQRAGVVAYRPADNGQTEVLLITARRNPKQWIFPVGQVDAGETLQQTAGWECVEESGYYVEVGSKLGMIEFDEGDSVNRMTFFIAHVIKETPHYETDRKRKWVPLSQLAPEVAEDFLPIARAAMTKLEN